jgi:3-dehydroquinate synthase
MVDRRVRVDGGGMTTELHRVRDTVPLPADDAPLIAHAERRDRYPIHVTATIDGLVDHLTAALGDGPAVSILTDETVDALYGATVVRALREAGFDPLVRAIPPGEASKSLDQAVALWHWLAESGAGRRDALVAFGGGVIADLGGWAASAFMRGVPYITVPTTLLAQVDGALGGKVAVNHPLAKNLIGAFHQPRAVIANVGFLASTSGRHLRAGLAEVIKKAMIASPAYWHFLEEHAEAILARDPAALERVVRCAAAIKTVLVERDPYEIDLRRPLNFGHTIGHPLETVTGYGPLLHGEAVALGMVVESRIATARGLMAPELLERLLALLRRCGLPTVAGDLAASVDGPDVIAAMEHVRLIRAGSLRYVLPVELGETAIADDVGEDEVRCALRDCGVVFPAVVVR